MTSKKRAGNSKEGEIQKNESAFAEISFANLRFGVSFISGFLDHDLFGLVDIGIDVISWMFFSTCTLHFESNCELLAFKTVLMEVLMM